MVAIHPTFVQKLDADYVDYFNKIYGPLPAGALDLGLVRANPKLFRNQWANDYSGEDFVRDIQLTSADEFPFKVRVYLPDSSKHGEGPYPIHLNVHGGGFVMGDVCTDSDHCLRWRNELGLVVVDVDYRLCPEYAFGKGHEDAWAALQWVHQHAAEIRGRENSISIGGISAGAHVVAVLQQRARDCHIPIKMAILSVPAVTLVQPATPEESPFASMAENKLAPQVGWGLLVWFHSHYGPTLAGADRLVREPIERDLSGLCPTFVATAELDPLRDEGRVYAEKLRAAGVSVHLHEYSGVTHPFVQILSLEKTKQYMDDVCTALGKAHAGAS